MPTSLQASVPSARRRALNSGSTHALATSFEPPDGPIDSAHSEKRRPTAGLSGAAQATTSAQVRRLIEEEHDRRWAYQPDSSQDSSFQSRFLSYAD